jgi:hypothetical protein
MGWGKKATNLLLDRGRNVKITEEVIKAVVLNKEQGTEIMTLLLEREVEVKITEGGDKCCSNAQVAG